MQSSFSPLPSHPGQVPGKFRKFEWEKLNCFYLDVFPPPPRASQSENKIFIPRSAAAAAGVVPASGSCPGTKDLFSPGWLASTFK